MRQIVLQQYNEWINWNGNASSEFLVAFKFPRFSPWLQPLQCANAALPSKQSRRKGVCLLIHCLSPFLFCSLSVCQILPKGVVSVIGPASSPASGSTVSHICGEKEVRVEDKHTYLCMSHSFSHPVCYHCCSCRSDECWLPCSVSSDIIKLHPLFRAAFLLLFIKCIFCVGPSVFCPSHLSHLRSQPVATLMNHP